MIKLINKIQTEFPLCTWSEKLCEFIASRSRLKVLGEAGYSLLLSWEL